MNYKTTTKAARAYFKPLTGPEFANPRVSRVLIGYGRSGYVSVRDWNGDRVSGMGAGGGGYDKTGVCLAQVLMALAGEAGMAWLAQNYGMNTGSDSAHGRAGLYGLRWYIEHARMGYTEKARAMTDKARAKSHKAPRRVPADYRLRVHIDGACGVSSVEACALALGFVWDRCTVTRDSNTWSARVVRTVIERTEWAGVKGGVSERVRVWEPKRRAQ